MFGYFFFRLVFLSFVTVTSVAGQDHKDQSGFISVDCGIPEGSNYWDSTTGIYYSSDEIFVKTGVSRPISPDYKVNSFVDQQFLTLRTFPEGTRNCYSLRPSGGKNKRYIIRARFLYGNYDGKKQLPVFDVHLGVEYWRTFSLKTESDIIMFEIIHLLTSDNITVCFINTGSGIPFVSVLEVRLLDDSNYQIYQTESSLDYVLRWDLGSATNEYIRYPIDGSDRIWVPHEIANTTTLSASDVDTFDYDYNIPSRVLSTAITPQNANESLILTWSPANATADKFYFWTCFEEVQLQNSNQSRTFDIIMNGELWGGPFSLRNMTSLFVHGGPPSDCSGRLNCELRITRTENSSLPPIINAFEVYKAIQFSEKETDANDGQAIMSIKSWYNVTRNWQGDPCAPEDYVWDGVNCSNDDYNPLRIVSLDLSSSGLTGKIAISIFDLKTLQKLDLSNNSLTGQVPDFLSQMASLRVLKLDGNNFTGPIPAELQDKSNKGLLSLSIDDLGNNTNPCQSVPCKNKNSKSESHIVAIVASVAAVVLGLLAAGLIFMWLAKKRKKQQVIIRVDEVNDINRIMDTKNRQFSNSEVLGITNNFERVIGNGGFGTVYHGYVGENQVAVKMLSASSIQGYKEFQTEVVLLMSVHHKNLTPLVGYCNEGNNMGIIYEYMANGDLHNHLSGWEERLCIAIDAAQGLEYLHHGCKPPIIHRDVKSTNILLTENFQAKIADFGLSRLFKVEGDSHVSTRVAGTPGYLDPEYYTSNRLTEKSDVYGFGIVLLEMVAGRPAIARTHDETHIFQWVDSVLQKGDVKNIVDPRLGEEFDVISVWKTVELAMACASQTSSKRPTMNYVVTELKECLAIEVAHHNDSKDSVGLMDMSPLAR